MAITGLISGIVYRALLRASLRKQRIELSIESEELLHLQADELTRRCQERFAKLISDMNHRERIPSASTTLGLLVLVLLETKSIIKGLETLYDKKDFNTLPFILQLQKMSSNELSHLTKSLDKWLRGKRDKLTRYNQEQGL